VLTTLTATDFFMERPYFSTTITLVSSLDSLSQLVNSFNFVLVWTSLLLIAQHFLLDIAFTGGFSIYLLGLPIVVLIVLLQKDQRHRLLIKPLQKFQKGKEFR